LAHRIEYYLNLPARIETKPTYEVIFGGEASLTWRNSPAICESRVAEQAKAYGGDAVVIIMAPMDLYYGLMAFMTGNMTDDGKTAELDPEAMLADDHAGLYKGLAQEFYLELKQNPAHYAPDLVLNEGGAVQNIGKGDPFRFYQEDKFRSLAERATLQILAGAKKKISAALPGKPCFIVFCPDRHFLADTENQGGDVALAGAPITRFYSPAQFLNKASELGFTVIDLTDRFAERSVAYFPSFLTDGHPSCSGVDLSAQLAAHDLAPYLEKEGVAER
jgi:hypothetical protein